MIVYVKQRKDAIMISFFWETETHCTWGVLQEGNDQWWLIATAEIKRAHWKLKGKREGKKSGIVKYQQELR